MKAIKLKDNIYWVGGIDWELRNFHGYMTQRGSTYNAYLVLDEKITLIDTAKYYLVDEMLERISSIIDPSKIDYIISNHVEMDHSGGLPRLMEVVPNAKIFTSTNGEKGLKAHYKKDWNFCAVSAGQKISTGKYEFTFVHTPMVHWPDNMVTYLPQEKILFSNDAFGQHIASSERLVSKYPFDIVLEEAAKYYANIVLPYGMSVQKALNTVDSLDIDMIAPSHGLVWDSKISEILKSYNKWSKNETDNKAVVVYDTMWNSTEMIAHSIKSALENKDINAAIFNLKNNHISDIMTHILTAKYIFVGSPTLNNNMLPTVSAFLTYLKGLSPKNRVGMAFGSYGWGGQSIEQVNEVLKELGWNTLPPIKLQYIPSIDVLSDIVKKIENYI